MCRYASEKCAKRVADMLAQSAKLTALVTESDRRLAMLDKLQAAAAGVTVGLYKLISVDPYIA